MVWEITTETPNGPAKGGMQAKDMSDVGFSSDGERLVSVSYAGARIWDAHTHEPLTEPIRHDASREQARLSPQGDRLLTAIRDKVYVLDARPGGLRRIPLTNFLQAAVDRVEFSPNGRWALAESGGSVEVREAKTWKVLSPPMLHPGTRGYLIADSNIDPALSNFLATASQRLMDLQISDDGQRAVTLGVITNGPATTNGPAAQIWNALTGAPVGGPISMGPWGLGITLSPDGERLVACGGGKMRIWNALTGQPMTDNIVLRVWVSKVTFSADSRFFIAGVDFWNAKTGQHAATGFNFKSAPHAAQFSPDGRLLATDAGVWEFPGGQQLTTFSEGKGYTDKVVFSPDGALLATVSGGVARIWDVQTWQLTVPPLQRAYNLQFSPDGRHLLATGDAAREEGIRVWDAHTGQPVSEPMRHKGDGGSASFTPDGRYVLTTKYEGTLVWPTTFVSEPIPAWFPELVEAVAGQRLNSEGGFDSLPPEAVLKYRTQLEQSKSGDSLTRWAKWFFAGATPQPMTPR